jgi:hypothetical protein
MVGATASALSARAVGETLPPLFRVAGSTVNTARACEGHRTLDAVSAASRGAASVEPPHGRPDEAMAM